MASVLGDRLGRFHWLSRGRKIGFRWGKPSSVSTISTATTTRSSRKRVLPVSRPATALSRNGSRLEERDKVLSLFERHKPDRVIHLAAQAGVRYSLEAPQAYVDSNITGFLSILEAARAHKPAHVVFASTSSVYGLDGAMPLSEHRGGNHPVSFYAATKKANEAMAHSYAHLFRIPLTGLRFFHRLRTVGPAGHGAVQIHQGDPRRRAGRSLQQRRHGAGFHLHRRHRRGHRAHFGKARISQ